MEAKSRRAVFLTTRMFWQDSTARPGQDAFCPADGDFAGGCYEYIALEYEGGSEVIQVKRQYHMPSEIIGEIGGLLKVALMFGMVYTIYNQARQKNFIIERIFSSEKKFIEENRLGPGSLFSSDRRKGKSRI